MTAKRQEMNHSAELAKVNESPNDESVLEGGPNTFENFTVCVRCTANALITSFAYR